MELTYVKVAAIYRKLKDSEDRKCPIYISGAVGFGKTSAVEYYYRRKAHLVLSGDNGSLEHMPEPSSISKDVVVIDGVSWITDSNSMNYIIDLLSSYEGHIVLIGRSTVPGWLRLASVEHRFMYADERDLALSLEETKTVLERYDVDIPEDQINKMHKTCIGNPLATIYCAYHMRGVNMYSPAIWEAARLDLFHYYDRAFYEKWDEEMCEMLLALCQYDTFTIEMAMMITGNNRIPILFEMALAVGTFLDKIDRTTYCYRLPLREFLKWKQSLVYTENEQKENYERAAMYYEMHNQIEKALFYYTKSGSEEKLSLILRKNARNHAGIANFFEIREYYYALPESTVCSSSVLMSAMSTLYSITLQPEKSEYWYAKLQEYEKNTQKGSPEQREASIRLAHLDISLAHRGIHGMVKIIHNIAKLVTSRGIVMPELSVTSNMPSIMNGGLDFCEWSRNDKELAVLMKYPIEIVLRSYGVGLVNIALAESGFEKNSMSSYDIMTRLNTGYMKSNAGGKIEMCFVATGILIREHMANGQISLGENHLKSFTEKAHAENATQLYANLETLNMWLELYKGNTEKAEKWLKNAPDEKKAFCTLDRYHYINKVQVLIALDRVHDALFLIEYLDVYFTQYERTYLWIQNQLLKAVCLYRMNEIMWEETLLGALKRAERYHFIRIIAELGIAIKPLLDNVKTSEVNEEFFNEIKQETYKMVLWYPKYLEKEVRLENPLTDMEAHILKLLCSGASTKDICEMCNCTINNLKFHNRNIYRKLGVNKRADAEREAARLGINR